MSVAFLNPENFKIDSTGRTIQDAPAVVNGKHLSIKVKINPE